MAKAIIKQSLTYKAIFDKLNKELFDGQLGEVMCTFSRNKNVVGGYFSPDKWEDDDGNLIPEIAINANLMLVSEPHDLYNTLIHEMLHQWQFEHGKPSRNGYHNQEWADKAKEIGLRPTDGNGKETGQAINTEFIEDGPAQMVVAEMLTKDDYIWPYYADHLMVDEGGKTRPQTEGEQSTEGQKENSEVETKQPPRSGSRTKYTCSVCGLNAWAKHGASLLCGECNRALVAQK